MIEPLWENQQVHPGGEKRKQQETKWIQIGEKAQTTKLQETLMTRRVRNTDNKMSANQQQMSGRHMIKYTEEREDNRWDTGESSQQQVKIIKSSKKSGKTDKDRKYKQQRHTREYIPK